MDSILTHLKEYYMEENRGGYIRVSSFDQNTDRQLDGLKLDRVFIDKASGKDIKRPEFEKPLAFVRAGDTIVVHSMDRLARNLDNLRQLVHTLINRGVRVQFSSRLCALSHNSTQSNKVRPFFSWYRNNC
jgi:DNA invertase Pin-like site-specific DNA recombinase